MHELLAQLETHLRMAWRYRWVGFVVSALVAAIGWSVVMLQPNVFRAETKIFADTSSLLRPALRGLTLGDSSQVQALALVRRTLLSRPNLETIARNTDMDLRTKDPKEFDAVVTGLSRNIRVSQARGDSVFSISYTNETPQLALRVVETVMNMLVERSLGESRKDTTATRAFLEQQIKEYEQRLVDSEQRRQRFKQENMGLLPGQGGYFERLQSQRGQLQEALLRLTEAEKRRDQLRDQMEDVDQWLTEADVPAYQAATPPHPLDGRIAKLEESLDQMLLRYTDQHPDVVSTRSMLTSLKSQRAQEVAAARGGAAGPGHSRERVENPLFQQTQMALGAAEAEVSALQARVDEYKRRAEETGKLLNASLQVETEVGRLDRDYGLEKRNYDELVKRREQLNMSDEANKTSDMMKIRIIEPPRLPSAPASPNRIALNAGVLAFAFAAGAAIAWLFGVIRPAVYSREEIHGFTEFPVLGAVTRVLSASQLREHRLRVALFTAGCVALVVGFGVTVVLEPQLMSAVGKLRELGAQFI